LSVDQPPVINGWNIFAHPLFLDQFEELTKQVNNLRCENPQTYKNKKTTLKQSESHPFKTDGRGLQASEPSSDDSPS
jgi:toxin YhaV